MQQISTGRQSLLDPRASDAKAWVLDTNVVLDLFVFEDPGCAALAGALGAAPGGWATTPAMLAEFEAVMARAEFARWRVRLDAARQHWNRLTTLIDPAPATQSELICADPDDQMFLDLAVSLGPCWLLSRDSAVLRLHRRAAAQASTSPRRGCGKQKRNGAIGPIAPPLDT